MKPSLLIHPTNNRYFNIGDYIQAIAASQYFNRKDFNYVDREALNQYIGEDTPVIMNGWFMFTNNWPPSEHIIPHFVAFHINSTATKVLLSDESIKYLKKHEPIGCRDLKSCDLLKAHGVDAYFSGCLTLTLGRSYHNNGDGKEIYIVDPLIEPKKEIKSLLSYAWTMAAKFSKVYKIYKAAENHTIMSLLKCVVFYNQYSKVFGDDILLNAHYPSVYVNNNFESEDAKFDYAKLCLERYSKAKLVITSKIHCQMPCLAMGTPSLFLKNDNDGISSTCRFDGLIDLYNIINYNKGDFSSTDIDLDNGLTCNTHVKNKNNHLNMAERLAVSCSNFVKSLN